ncbi:MAG: SEC-C metal-binding domain-containing protein [Nitrospiraceae bacterium]|nr:SEC-C metal-binding domain-containing protein [Nitrospiraceae bacterium]
MGLFDGIRTLFQSSEQTPPAVKPGRNEPCWCGSGKKYKKCHEPGEMAKAAERACSLNCGPT